MAITEDTLRNIYTGHDINISLTFKDPYTLQPDCPRCGEKYVGFSWWDTTKGPNQRHSANRGTILFCCGRGSDHARDCYERAGSPNPRDCDIVYIFCYKCADCSFGAIPPRTWFGALFSA